MILCHLVVSQGSADKRPIRPSSSSCITPSQFIHRIPPKIYVPRPTDRSGTVPDKKGTLHYDWTLRLGCAASFSLYFNHVPLIAIRPGSYSQKYIHDVVGFRCRCPISAAVVHSSDSQRHCLSSAQCFISRNSSRCIPGRGTAAQIL